MIVYIPISSNFQVWNTTILRPVRCLAATDVSSGFPMRGLLPGTSRRGEIARLLGFAALMHGDFSFARWRDIHVFSAKIYYPKMTENDIIQFGEFDSPPEVLYRMVSQLVQDSCWRLYPYIYSTHIYIYIYTIYKVSLKYSCWLRRVP